MNIRCPHCEEALWIEQNEVDIELSCPRCEKKFIWAEVLDLRKRNMMWLRTEMDRKEKAKTGLFLGLGIVTIIVVVVIILAAQEKGQLPEQNRLVEQRRAEEEARRRTAATEAEREKEERRRTEEGRQQQEEQQRSASVSFIRISAEEVWEEYDANEVAADAKYKGKILVVTGVVTEVGKEIIFGTPYVALAGKSNGWFGDTYLGGTVHCSFSKSDEAALSALSKRDYVCVAGVCTGKFILFVQLKPCVIR